MPSLRQALTAAVLTTLAGVALLAVPAGAHVSVNPGEAPKGGFTKVAFRVPNERDVGTTKVEVTFPADHPIAFVSVRPVAGWTYAIERTRPATQVEAEGDEVTEVVSKITWTGGPIKAGEFQEFDVSLGPLPDDADALVFKAVQTYESGEVVRWIEEPSGDEEPEHPAPVLTLVDSDGAEESHGQHDEGEANLETGAPTSDDVNGAQRLGIAGIVVGVVGLLVGVVALVRRRPAA